MTDGQNDGRRIDWRDVFDFSLVFKSFRMAIHPSKLLLALAAIAVIFLAGSVLDGVWSLGNGYVQNNAVFRSFAMSTGQYDLGRDIWLDNRAENAATVWTDATNQQRSLGAYMSGIGISVTGQMHAAMTELIIQQNSDAGDWKGPDAADQLAKAKDSWTATLSNAEKAFGQEDNRIEQVLDTAQDNADKAIDALDSDQQDQAREKLTNDFRKAGYALTARKRDFYKSIENIRGRGIFSTLADHEGQCLSNATMALCRGDLTGGLNLFQETLRKKRIGAGPGTTADVSLPAPAEGGFVFWGLMALSGFSWMVCEHLIFAAIFLLITLAVWSLLGGAVHRIAALQATRQEKISIVQAMKFSMGKFFSFFTAPLIPLAIILLLGFGLVIGGVIGNAWGLGMFIVSLLFVLALLVGLIIAFLVVGLVGGAGLMYPTIAVEGSDSFDAISRSFTYIFEKPWRAAIYTLAALLHGMAGYVFVRAFAFIALWSAHFFVKGGIWQGGQTLPGACDKLDIMWTAPTFASLHAPCRWEAMSTMEHAGAILITFWVYLIIGLVGAYILTYASSASTVIYCLLRRKVDATDIDDVYVDEADQDEQIDVPAEDDSDSDADNKSEEESKE